MEIAADCLPPELLSPLPVSLTRSRNRRFDALNRITDVANRVNQWRFAEFLAQPTNEHLNQLGIVLVLVFPNAFTKLCAREHAAGLAHQYLRSEERRVGK